MLQPPLPPLPVDCLLISDNYWPALRGTDTMTLHADAATTLARYMDTYALLKRPRKLKPMLQLGRVELQLDFNDGSSRTFSVTPVQVSIAGLTL